MTRPRYDKHSTEFGLWLRRQTEIDSALGYVTSNIDYLWQNYKRVENGWLLLEEKRHDADLTYSQRKLFVLLNAACQHDPAYRGFYVVKFENTSPDDGRIWIEQLGSHSREEVSSTELLGFLKTIGTH